MTVEKALEPITALEDIGLEKQSAEVIHQDAVETNLTPAQQKRLM